MAAKKNKKKSTTGIDKKILKKIQSEPLQSLGIAFGAGFAAGILLALFKRKK